MLMTLNHALAKERPFFESWQSMMSRLCADGCCSCAHAHGQSRTVVHPASAEAVYIAAVSNMAVRHVSAWYPHALQCHFRDGMPTNSATACSQSSAMQVHQVL